MKTASTLCLKKRSVEFLQQLYQILTDFGNSFTVGNKNKLSTKKRNTSRQLLKTWLHYRVKHKSLKSAF